MRTRHVGQSGNFSLGGRGPNPPGSKTLAGGAGTPGTVKNTEPRAAMPPASEAGVTPTKPKEENGWPAKHANHAKPKGVAEAELPLQKGTYFDLRDFREVLLLSSVSCG